MHLQVRTAPKSSPPDVEKLLGRLAEAGVNLVAVGGSNVEFGGERDSYRQIAIVQANEPDSDRRYAIEEARNGVLEAELNPLHVAILERAHELADGAGAVVDGDDHGKSRRGHLSHREPPHRVQQPRSGSRRTAG